MWALNAAAARPMGLRRARVDLRLLSGYPNHRLLPPDPHEPRWLTWMRNRDVRRTLTLSGLWLFLAVLLLYFHETLLPFALAALLAFVIEPVVSYIEARQVGGRRPSRLAAVLSVYVLAGLLLTIGGRWALGQIAREAAGLGSIHERALSAAPVWTRRGLDKVQYFFERNQLPFDRKHVEAQIEEGLQHSVDEVGHNAARLLTVGRNIVGGAFKTVFGVFLVLMLTAFLCIDRLRIEAYFQSLVPASQQTAYRIMLARLAHGLAGVVRGQFLICVTNGALTFVGLWLLGVRLPLLLAGIATVFSLIPIFGSILSTIPIVVVAITDSVSKGIFALLWIVGIHLIEANLLNPKIMGNAARIHPIVVVFALIVGERSAGLVGALFAVPVASVLVTVFSFLHRRATGRPPGTLTEDLTLRRAISDAPPAPDRP